MIIVRNYDSRDVSVTWELKFNTIRNINIRDYTATQVKAWAPDNFDMKLWEKRINNMNPFIAELDGQVVGFADLQEDGYIDHFFCHSEHQGVGVGRALMEHILAVGDIKGISRFYSGVSITARAFYEHYGFKVVEEQHIKVQGEILNNFIMEKVVIAIPLTN